MLRVFLSFSLMLVEFFFNFDTSKNRSVKNIFVLMIQIINVNINKKTMTYIN